VIFEVRDVKTSQSNRPVAVVLMSGVLHYIDTLAEALPGMLTLRKPDGWWVAHEPHPGTPRMRLAPVVRKRLDPHYASDHQERSAADLRHLYGRAGLVDMRMVPQGLLATPCAEVMLQPPAITQGLAARACSIDAGLERLLGRATTIDLACAGGWP
jgi:hypothetical protein